MLFLCRSISRQGNQIDQMAKLIIMNSHQWDSGSHCSQGKPWSSHLRGRDLVLHQRTAAGHRRCASGPAAWSTIEVQCAQHEIRRQNIRDRIGSWHSRLFPNMCCRIPERHTQQLQPCTRRPLTAKRLKEVAASFTTLPFGFSDIGHQFNLHNSSYTERKSTAAAEAKPVFVCLGRCVASSFLATQFACLSMFQPPFTIEMRRH